MSNKELADEEEFILGISRNEALFLDDSFTLLVQRDAEDNSITYMRPIQMTAGLAVPIELMEKVGKAVLYTTEPDNLGKDYKFPVSISELYMIREVASSFVRVGDEPVGFSLKRKVCDLLYGDLLKKESSDRIAFKLLKEVEIIPNKVSKDKPLE